MGKWLNATKNDKNKNKEYLNITMGKVKQPKPAAMQPNVTIPVTPPPSHQETQSSALSL